MSIHNEEVAKQLEQIADLLEIGGANAFRVRAYRNAARTVRSLGPELADLMASGKRLDELPAIGKDLATQIEDILRTGRSSRLRELKPVTPTTLTELLEIPKLGPKRVKKLYEALGVRTVAQLEQAARSGRLRELTGFGAATETAILAAVAARRRKKGRVLRAVAARDAEPLAAFVRALPAVEECVIGGSYRRGRESVGDIDLLACAGHGREVIERFVGYDDVDEVLSQGTTRASLRLRGGLNVDLRVVPRESFGAALQYFTGNKAHNIAVRRRGQERGLKINEYGVFRDDVRIAGDTEDSVYAAVDLRVIPPELRESRGEIEAAVQGTLPRLVERSDLKGDLHAHTDASDGRASLEAMAQAARDAGLEYLAITDHATPIAIAHGLTKERLRAQWRAIDAVSRKHPDVALLKGVEVDILEDGSLYLPDAVLAELDVVIVSVHSHFDLPRAKQTQRILKALERPYVSVLAHPTGRLLEERDGIDVDLERVLRAAAARGCCVEVNSQPKRRDLPDIWCRMAKDIGVPIVISSDAHDVGGFGQLEEGVLEARRGWLEKSDVLNTLPLTKLRKRLAGMRRS